MFPRHHIILGFIFAAIIYFSFGTTIYQAGTIFLASFLIDADHYFTACMAKKKMLWYGEAFRFHIAQGERLKKLASKGIKEKETFHPFHTIEFNTLILLLVLFLNPLFYFILAGMIFHIILDIYWLRREGILTIREFSLIKYLMR
jgi:hypothetical protein